MLWTIFVLENKGNRVNAFPLHTLKRGLVDSRIGIMRSIRDYPTKHVGLVQNGPHHHPTEN